MDLDPRTLTILLGLSNLIQAIVLFLQYKISKNKQGLGFWTLGGGCATLGFLLTSLVNHPVVGHLAMVSNNVVFIAGIIFFYVGTLRFFGQREHRGRLLAFGIIFTLLIIYSTYINERVTTRRVELSIGVAIFSLLIARALFIYRTRAVNISSQFVALAFLINVLVFIVRAIVNLTQPEPSNPLAPEPMQTVTYLTMLIASTLWTMGFILMVNQRLSEENREARENVEVIFNTISDPVTLTRLTDGHFVRINNSFSAITGYTPDETIGKTLQEVPIWENPADRQRFTDIVRQTGQCKNFSANFRRKDGSLFQGILCANMIEIGGIPHLIIQDISERKQIEEARRESEQNYRLLFETMTQGVVFQNADGRVIDANSSAEQILGLTQAELQERTFSDSRWKLILEDGSDFPRELHPAAVALQTGQPINNVVMGVQNPKFDSYRWINVNAMPRFNPGEEKPYQVYTTFEDITERKHMELVLRENEEKYRILFQNSPDSYLIVVDGVFVDCNHAAEMMLQSNRAQIIGQKPEMISPKFQPDGKKSTESAQEKIEVAFEKGSNTFEWLHQRPDGTNFLVEVSIAAIHFEGKPALFTTWRDITARKRAEIELRDREERYRALSESAFDAIISADSDGQIMGWNRGATAIFGYAADEILGKSVDILMPTRYAKVHDSSIQRLQTTGEHHIIGQVVEWAGLHKDGHEFPLELSLSEWKVESGTFYTGIIRDITERKRAEVALRENQAFLSELIENNGAAIYVKDKTGKYELVNKKWEEVTGLSRNSVIGKTDLEIFPGNIGQSYRQTELEVMQRGTVEEVEEIFIDESGTRFFLTIKFPIRENGQEIQGVCGISTEITARKQIEAELEAERVSLAQRVEDRTAELRNANAELTQALKIKDEFLSTMSHELRTPLNAILGLSEALLEQLRGPLNERQKASLHTIENSGRHLLSLINDMLDISKVDAGHLELHMESVPVIDICESSLSFVKELAIKKGLKLGLKLDGHLTTMQMDARRLKQILINLLSNAVKFTPANGEVRLEVDVDQENKVVSFVVQDTGIGISPENITRLFQPFVQLDSGLNRQYEGTGLGLALVRRLVTLQGGSISVESELNKGSRFTVILPYHP